MTDHLARLCFEGSGGSSGEYTPQAYRLRLAGVRQPLDHVVYLHEVHHAALNDVTAWGSALHVYARLPGGGQRFGVLLDACRVAHESLATFASVEIAAARHGPLADVLAVYPDYAGIFDETARLLTAITGPGRRQIMASALARLCMQTPVLDEIIAAGVDGFRLAAIREMDRPDTRWRWFIRQGPQLPALAAAGADRALIEAFGSAALDTDGQDGDLALSTDRSHDEAWEYWEESAYQQLRTALASTAARTLDFNGHQDGTAALLEQVAGRYGDIGVRPAMPAERRHDDATVASSVLQQVRHDLSGPDPYRAVLIEAADTASLVRVLATRPVLGDRPAMIIDARPAHRLAVLYRWPGDGLPDRLRAEAGPVVAVRLMIDDGKPGSAVGHVVLPSPDELSDLAGLWQDRGPLVVCASASCFADTAWTQRWLPALRSTGSLFVLVDVEPDRFVPAWARDRREVTAIGVAVEDLSGQRTALVFTPGEGAAWWLVVADDVTVRLVIEYLKGQLGGLMRTDAEAFGPIRDDTIAVVSHLLATESFVSFDGLEGGAHARG
ncbi:MAG TPA: hypothetical protein VFQ44_30255 [Streptosporangiaceae bacterium]|nr:hypothetical protein [Streptosporangiaceae bacterium]